MTAPRMMTLAEARYVVERESGAADVRAGFINWDNPMQSGAEMLCASGVISPTVGAARTHIGFALLAYAARLSHEAGRVFELAAIKRLVQNRRDVANESGTDSVFTALHNMCVDIDTGLHHAEPEQK